MTRSIRLGLSMLLTCLSSQLSAEADSLQKVDWPTFLAQHDPVWTQAPNSWGTGALLGNGLIGANIWAAHGETLHWDLGRADLYADSGRMPLGKFVLHTQAESKHFSMHQSLWNAECRGRIKTEKGTLSWRSFIPRQAMGGMIELTTTGNEQADLTLHREPVAESHKLFKALRGKMEPSTRLVDFSDPSLKPIIRELSSDPQLFKHPPHQTGVTNTIQWLTQPFAEGGGYTLAWAQSQQIDNTTLFAYAIDRTQTGTVSPNAALKTVQTLLNEGYEASFKQHTNWWHAYYTQSYLTIPDKALERFYWHQMHKMGAATREDGVILDLMGPWFRATPWARVWVNLNFQLTYWPLLTANHLELAEPAWRLLNNHAENFHNAVKNPEWRPDSMAVARAIDQQGVSYWNFEYGNMVWMLHNYWLFCRYAADDTRLKNELFPPLQKAVNFMLHALERDENGIYHIPADISPEYKIDGKIPKVADNTYNLGLLRWGLKTLITIHDRFQLASPDRLRWEEVLNHLPPYSTNENGLMVGAETPFSVSHRHHSHLIPFYPLHLLDPASSSDRPLIEKSLNHWTRLQEQWRPWSASLAAGMHAWLGDGERARDLLHQAIDTTTEWPGSRMNPNTLYMESGPCFETPMSITRSLQQMLLQSRSLNPESACIRIFPAVPNEWQDLTFHNLRTEGGFLVSAQRKNGILQTVRIKSLAGEPCRLRVDFPKGFSTSGSRLFKVEHSLLNNNEQILKIDLQQGEEIVLEAH